MLSNCWFSSSSRVIGNYEINVSENSWLAKFQCFARMENKDDDDEINNANTNLFDGTVIVLFSLSKT